MTIPPPPGIGNPAAQVSPTPPGAANPFVPAGVPRNASPLPLVVGAVVFLASIGLNLYALKNSLLESNPTEVWIHFLGYILTPFLMVFAMAWDLVSQRTGMRDINFFPRRKYSTILRALTIASFVVAIFHITPIASYVAEKLAS